MLATLRQPNFALLWTAGLVSQIGNWVLIAALPFYVYERTGSTLASGMIWIAYTLPGLLLGSVAGVFVDRWDRKRTMVVVNLLQAALMLVLLLVGSAEWLWLVYLVALLESALGQFFAPAENSLLPSLVGEERLLQANALNSLNDNLARVVGPSLGGALFGFFGLQAVVLVDSASFLVAGVLISLISSPAASRGADIGPTGDEAAGSLARVWREWIAGLGLVRANRVLRAVFIVMGVSLLADSILTALLVPFVNSVAEGGAQALGAILTVRGVAGLIGGVVIGWVGKRAGPARILGWSLILLGALFLVEVNFPYIPLILMVTLLNGPPVIGWLTGQQTLLQAGTDDEYRGRVFGAYGTTNALMLLAGTGLGSFLGDIVGVVPLLNVSGVLYSLAGLLALGLLSGGQVVAGSADREGQEGPVASSS